MRFKDFFLNIILVGFLIYFGFKYSQQKISYFYPKGELRYLDFNDLNLQYQKFIENMHPFFSYYGEFQKNILRQNPEIQEIKIHNNFFDTVTVELVPHPTCCVVIDDNLNKFLVDSNGKIIKRLLREIVYPTEISINQAFKIGDTLNLEAVQKITSIESIFMQNKIEIKDIFLENQNIKIKTSGDRWLILDNEVSVTEFWEKYQTISKHLSFNQKDYKFLDFRFDKVVVK